MIQEILWKVFPPCEVSFVKDQIREFFGRNFEDEMMYMDLFDLKETICRQATENPKSVVDEIRMQHKSASHVALKIIFSVSCDRIASGRHRENDGSLNSTGVRLREFAKSAIVELKDKGFIDAEKAERARLALDSN